jgi:hypothetical protein
MTTQTTTTWAGWFRPSRKAPWERLAEAASYGACLDALHEATHQDNGEVLIAPVGLDPNRDSASRRPGQ